MKIRFILAAAALACGALAVGSTQAAPQGGLVVADNEHKDEHKGAPQGGGQPTPTHTNTMTGPSHGANTMSGPTHGTNTMGGPNHMNTQMNMGTQGQQGGGTPGGQHNRVNSQVHVNGTMGTATPNRNFSRKTYQRNFTAPHQYHIAHYRRPHRLVRAPLGLR